MSVPGTAAQDRWRWLLVGLAFALAAVGIVANVWRPTAPPLLGTPTGLDEFAPEVLEVISTYRDPRRVARLATTLVHVSIPVAFLVVRPWRRWLVGLATGTRPWLAAATVVAVPLLLGSVLTLPLDLWMDWARERDWGFATGSLGLWLRDRVVGLALTVLVAGLVAIGVRALVLRYPRTWHWLLVPLATLGAALLLLIHPLVVQPLFLSTEPLADSETRDAVRAVLIAAGEPELGIEVGDASLRTSRVNAFVTGLGPSRRVVLYDTLLELPPEQVAYVVAHELAHRAHRDIPRGIALTAAGTLPLVLVWRRVWEHRRVRRALDDPPPASPLVVIVGLAVVLIGNLLGVPAANVASRRAEAAADHRALEYTGDPAVQIALNRVFVLRDLADPTPPRWAMLLWGTHPPAARRIAAAVDHAERSGTPLPSLAQLRTELAEVRHPRLPPP